MTTPQEYLDQKYPTKEEREKLEDLYIWIADSTDLKEGVCGGIADLSSFVNLKVISSWAQCLTSVDFLNTIPNPEKLGRLLVWNNEIKPTNIEVFSRFINLRELKIGTSYYRINKLRATKRNCFYGSLKSFQNLTKLKEICIEATDVNEGLEYLPLDLVQRKIKKGNYSKLECSSHIVDAKVKEIQNQLRPHNYDLEAWQLAHPEKMFISRPELFTNPESKEKWINALKEKIGEAETELLLTETNKVKKIARLEQKQEKLKKVFTSSLPKRVERIDGTRMNKELTSEQKLSRIKHLEEQLKEVSQQRQELKQNYSRTETWRLSYEDAFFMDLNHNERTDSNGWRAREIKEEINKLKNELENKIEIPPK